MFFHHSLFLNFYKFINIAYVFIRTSNTLMAYLKKGNSSCQQQI